MSVLGYVIAIMVCQPETSACEMLALRVSRFSSLSQCQSTIPDVLRTARRRFEAASPVSAHCRSLDELCAGHVAHHDLSRPARPFYFVSSEPRRSSRPAVDEALSVLCSPPPESGC